jgi:DNA-3-methyladenine glycosylase II
MNQIVFALTPLAPFRLDLTVWALRRRPHNAVDLWDGQVYRRVVLQRGEPIIVEVVQQGSPDAPQLQATARSASDVAPDQATVAEVLRRLLGLDIDLAGFYAFAAADAQLGPLAARFRGFKPPRYATLFEALLNGVACQQVTLNLGVQLLNRLAASYGVGLAGQDSQLRTLPQPAALIEQSPEALRALGLSRQKAQTMLELARAQLEGRLSIDDLAQLENEAAVGYLRQFRGIGRWTAEYALLRGLGRLNVFPSGDSGARNSLRRWLDLDASLDYAGVAQAIDPWQAYAGLIYLHLLLKGLAEAEQL